MRVTLDYGRDGLPVDLPDRNVVGVLTQTPAPRLADPDDAIRSALRAPIGTRPLAEIARERSGGQVCIVICDITRPVPNALLLPAIAEELAVGGIPRNNLTILIATGTHRPNVGEELVELVGAEFATGVRIVNHDSTDFSALRDFGTTPNGVPVRLNRHYTEADLRITVGLIEPHFMAGYSGGRKLIMPGIAGLETVQAWHSPRFLEHPNATAGITVGNPVHEENTLIARLCPPDLIVDVTLDAEKKITGVFAGELEAAWNAGVEFAARHVRVSVPEPVDIAITTGAGAPLDATFYQAVKGMVGALPIVRRGGTIIIAAACTEGIGGPHFRRCLLETRDLQGLVENLQRPDHVPFPDQWQAEELARATRFHEVRMFCEGIPSDLLGQLHVTPAESVERAVEAALAIHGPDARIAVLPKGPYVIPYVAGNGRSDGQAGEGRRNPE
ncbi:MAG: nickel-dependent lactate racemase [Capsulimonadales bacterium]|nr:nickel-dependent lactate racemase [Capsulimonadales bacterium]